LIFSNYSALNHVFFCNTTTKLLRKFSKKSISSTGETGDQKQREVLTALALLPKKSRPYEEPRLWSGHLNTVSCVYAVKSGEYFVFIPAFRKLNNLVFEPLWDEMRARNVM